MCGENAKGGLDERTERIMVLPLPTGDMEPEDGDIILETHTGSDRVIFDGNEYTLAENRDVIQILPVNDQDDIRTYYKPFWKVVKQ